MDTQEMQFPYTSLTKTELGSCICPNSRLPWHAESSMRGLPATGN